MHRRLRRVLSAQAQIAKAILAVALALAVLTKVVPPEVVSASPNCPMPCCQGASATQGNCAGGSCHVSLAEFGKPAEPFRAVEPAEPLCGLKQALERVKTRTLQATVESAASQGSAAKRKSGHRHVSPHGATPQLATATLNKPCNPGCGSPVNASTRIRRSSDAAALSFKLRPRLPSIGDRARDDAQQISTTSAWRQPCRPRGPPFS